MPAETDETFSLEGTARRVGHYRWVEMRLFEALGAWVATVPELDAKLRLGIHCYKHAWHSELWHARLPELAGMNRERLTTVANDELATFMDAMTAPDSPDQTIEKLVGAYRVLIPHMIAAYSFHLDNTSSIRDGPTIRSLKLILADEIEDWREGEMMIQALLKTGNDVRRAAEHQGRLETLILASGGISGPA